MSAHISACADAEIAVHDLLGRHRDADLGKAGGIGPTGDHLAVDQHAVAIEDDQFGRRHAVQYTQSAARRSAIEDRPHHLTDLPAMRPSCISALAAVLLLLCGAGPPPKPHACSPPRRSRAWTRPGGAPATRPSWQELRKAACRSGLPRRFAHPGLGGARTARMAATSRPIWQRFYGDRNAINLGFTGDATAHLLWRIENGEVAGIAPKVAVDPDRRQQSRPSALVGRGHGRRHRRHRRATAPPPAAHQTAAARRSAVGPLAPGSPRTTAAVNKALAARYRRGGDVTYLDIGHVFMQDGRLNRDLFFDPKLTPPGAPLHPSAGRPGADGRGDRADARRTARRPPHVAAR